MKHMSNHLVFVVVLVYVKVPTSQFASKLFNIQVLVTAAAGGTGQFAVQLAKLAGCHVIGTCSTDAKVKFLESIGCDHPINISKEVL